MNLFSGIGRLAKDVDLRVTPSNVSVANSTIAINRPFKNADGEREADFINIVAFRKTAELLSQYFHKGKQIGVSGRIQSRNFENKEGQRVFVTELVVENITFINDGSGNQNQGAQPQQNNYRPNTNTQQNQSAQGGYEPNPFADPNGPVDINSDDLPF